MQLVFGWILGYNQLKRGEEMNQNAICELSADLIIKYYNNDYMPFLMSMDDEALWYGPAEGQFLQGRENMIKVWQAEEHNLTFTIGNMKVRHISPGSAFCDVMLSYSVVTHYPDGHNISVFQRLQMTWCERKEKDENGKTVKVPRILVCHISNPHSKHEDDTIYPVNFAQIYAGDKALPQRGERIHFHGADRSDYFFLSDSIYWIEATAGGKRSILHTASDEIEVLMSVSQLERQYGHLYLRCHQSYLINPHFISNIYRFGVSLTDGSNLPIPEKKYTAFRKKAMEIIKH